MTAHHRFCSLPQVKAELAALKAAFSRLEPALSQDVSALEETVAAQQKSITSLADNVNRALQSTAEASRVLAGYPPLSLYSGMVTAPTRPHAKPQLMSRAAAHLDSTLVHMDNFVQDLKRGSSPGRRR